MNLRAIHAVLIFLSAALAVVFGLWCLDQSSHLAAIAAFIVSFGLIVYDSWFLRKTRMLR